MASKRICWLGLIVLIASASFVQAESVTLKGSQCIFDSSVAVTYNIKDDSSPYLLMREYFNNDYEGFGAYDRRIFVRVDISSLPAGAQIDSVSFNMKVDPQISNPADQSLAVDLWKVAAFTNSMTWMSCDGTNPWPDMDAQGYDVTYFDGIDGYNRTPADRLLATSVPINGDESVDTWVEFAGTSLSDYVQSQSDQNMGARYLYFELSWPDGDCNYWCSFYSTEAESSDDQPYLVINYTPTTPPPSQDNELTIKGPENIFDCYAAITYSVKEAGMPYLKMREYWNNNYAGFGAYDMRIFVRVDLTSLPQDAVITSAALNMKLEAQTSNPADKSLQVDLWNVSPFTPDMTAQTCDGVNVWPNLADGFTVSYFDGVDGYYQKPIERLLASSSAVNADMVDTWVTFAGNKFTNYITAQSALAAGQRYAYFELSWPESTNNYWCSFYSTEAADANRPYLLITWKEATLLGDANGDGMVDVSDLGILAANYGMTSGATLAQGDFNGDGAVDVSDLGILAAHYGEGTQAGADFNADYAKVFGTAAEGNASEDTTSSACSSLGLSLIVGLAMLGLMLVKLEE